MSFYDDASLIMYPSGYKEDKIYSLKPTNGTGDLTFSRASSATRVNAEGLIETASIIGSEEVTNGDFATDSDWNKGSGSTISGGNLNIISAPYNATTRQTISLTSGATYQILINATAVGSATANTFQLGFGDSSGNPSSTTQYEFAVGSSTKTLTVTASATDTTIIFRSRDAATSNLTIHSVSVKEVITSNVPRIDYSNGCGSLLLEKQSTNLVTYSEDFSNAAWIKDNVTITSDASTSPEGISNATKLIPNTSTAIHRLRSNTVSISTNGAYSAFVKADGYTKVALREDNAIGHSAVFDLSDGSVMNTNASGVANIDSYGNGWYRIYFDDDAVSSTCQLSIYVLADSYTSGDPAARPWAGDGTKGIYIYGAQVEQSSYPTSYIPTSGTTVTRLADTCYRNDNILQTDNFTNVIDFFTGDLSATQQTFSFGTWAVGNSNSMPILTSGNYRISTHSDFASGKVLAANTRYKIGYTISGGVVTSFVNGVKDINAVTIAINIILGGSFTLGYHITQSSAATTSKFNSFQNFNTVLTDTELATLTTL